MDVPGILSMVEERLKGETGLTEVTIFKTPGKFALESTLAKFKPERLPLEVSTFIGDFTDTYPEFIPVDDLGEFTITKSFNFF